MLRKIVLTTTTLLVLSACASPGDLRQRTPEIDQMSATPAERLAGCIGDKLEAAPNAGTRFSTRPTANGYSIAGEQAIYGLYGAGSDTIVLIDVTKQNDQSHVQIWSHNLIGVSPFVAVAKTCL